MNRIVCAPLGEVAKLNPTFKAKDVAPDELVDFLPMSAVSAELTNVCASEQRPFSEVQKGYTNFADGDVLLAKITPCFENGKIAFANVNADYGFGSTEFHVIRADKNRLDGRYLVHFLRRDEIRVDGARNMTGSAGQRRVPKHYLESLSIPLPALSEQHRIAAILDQADALRAKRREALAQLDSLTQSIFIEMFGDPVTNPMAWPESTSLGEIADIVSGVTKGRNLEGKATRTIPYLAVANVQDKSLNLTQVKTIEATEDEIRRYELKPNDLLLTEGGDPDKLGRGTLWRNELPECIHQNHIFRVRVVGASVSPLFLNWLVGSQCGKKYFLKSAKQTTGIASINMGQLRKFPLLVPPLSLQQSFGARIQSVEALKAKHRAALHELDRLFASLQHRAFAGEL